MANNRNYGGGRAGRVNFAPIIAVLVILLGIAGAGGFLVYDIFLRDDGLEGEAVLPPNMEEINFFEFNTSLDAGRINVVVGGEIAAQSPSLAPIFIHNRLYFSAEFLRQYVDRYIFWESGAGRLTITNYSEVMRFRPNETVYTVNWEPRELEEPILEIAGMAYLSAEMVMARYGVSIAHHEEYNFVVMDLHSVQRSFYEVVLDVEDEGENGTAKWVPLRFGPDDQFPIAARLYAGDEVLFLEIHREYDDEGEFAGLSGYYRVRMENGLLGFVLAENLRFANQIAAVPQASQRRPMTRNFDGPINLVYHQMGMNNPASWFAPRGVNVTSPYWFSFVETEPGVTNGNIRSVARNDYLNWARANGIEVWPMFTDNFNNAVSRAVLMDAYMRDHVIEQILELIALHNFEGININFEAFFSGAAEYWIQFLRELAVPMRDTGAVLSVASMVPGHGNDFWNHEEIGMTADFIVIMAYDEHWSTSPVAGPVGSFDFIDEAILRTVGLVPSERVVVALPTYVFIWREQFLEGDWVLDEGPARAVGMAAAREHILSRGGEFVWDYIIRQYYGEVNFEQNGIETRYRVWLEDLRSMEEKLTVYHRYNLGGVAFWQKYLALPGMWDLVYENLRR